MPVANRGLARQLQRSVRGAVSDGARRRAEYSSDAGNYRVLPAVVVEPLDVDDVLATLEFSRSHRDAGHQPRWWHVGRRQRDRPRHRHRLRPAPEPGAGDRRRRPHGAGRTRCGAASLQTAARAARACGSGPDPSTQDRATLGGMIGNNACGPHAVAYGRTADNVQALTVVDGPGRRVGHAGWGAGRFRA